MKSYFKGNDAFRYREEGSTGLFTVTRPSARNALNLACIDGLGEVVAVLARRPMIRALIIESEGGEAFVAGGDVREFSTMYGEVAGRALSEHTGRIFTRMQHLSQTVIAAIDGDAYGGGVELALACDLRIMSPDARLGFTQSRFGLTTGWGGGSRLVGLIGYSRALDVLLNARLIDAETSLSWGLANYIDDDPSARAKVIAERVGRMGFELSSGIKNIMRAARDLDPDDARAEESGIFGRLWASPAHEEKVARFLERGERQKDVDPGLED